MEGAEPLPLPPLESGGRRVRLPSLPTALADAEHWHDAADSRGRAAPARGQVLAEPDVRRHRL